MSKQLEEFNRSAIRVLVNSQVHARRMDRQEIGAEHLLIGLWAGFFNDDGSRRHTPLGKGFSLKEMGLHRDQVEAAVQVVLGRGPGETPEKPPFTTEAKKVLGRSLKLAHNYGPPKGGRGAVGPEHILVALMELETGPTPQVLARVGCDRERAAWIRRRVRSWLSAGRSAGEAPTAKGAEREAAKAQQEEEAKAPESLSSYARDLTAAAKAGKIDPVVGRDEEISRIKMILGRKGKNNPVIIGEPGVGKTAIVEGLAREIAGGGGGKQLKGKQVWSLDLGSLMAGTRYRGDFEERLKGVVDAVIDAGPVPGSNSGSRIVLFIDEIHTLVGAGAGEGAMDAANLLKPALARGELQVVGATTIDEYRKYIEKDAALERRFSPVRAEEPSQEDAEAILLGIRESYESHHGVRILDEAVKSAVSLSARYVTDRYLPDKAIDLVDEAASTVADRRPDGEVGEDDVALVLSSWTDIPVGRLERKTTERLLAMEDAIRERVIGQHKAISAVCRSVRRSASGLSDPKRPSGSFLFLGPTGVGKTELARALSEFLFGEEDAMIRLDMSEFQEKHTVSRLVGSPPGYVGHDEGGQLTEAVRRKPYSVVLFDEMEKAHPDVFNALLQVLDDGRLTDSKGKTVNFRNTVLVMTSNVGAREILGEGRADGARRRPMGFSPAPDAPDGSDGALAGELEEEELRERVSGELGLTFRPEFLNRIDETVIFRKLSREELRGIVRIQTKGLLARLSERGVSVAFTDEALDALAEDGYDPAFGARPLKRLIQREVEDPLSDLLLREKLPPGVPATVEAAGPGTGRAVYVEVGAALVADRER